jgi:ubiquitin C-terminal hydrolase
MKLVSFPNLGNTCYLNSVLQNIIYDHDFGRKILSCEVNSFNKQLQKIVKIIHTEPFEIVNFNLIKFINYFTTEKKLFNKYEQHDAHEFLGSFIDLLIENNKGPDSTFKKEYHGLLRLNITCTLCNNIKQVYEEFNSINLNIPETSEKLLSIYNLFEEYLCKEMVESYFCEKCNCNCISEQKVTLWKLPKKLILVFKRYTPTGNKILTHVDYTNGIKIRETCTNKILSYNLSGIVNHIGDLYKGHYTSNVKINNKWYFMDDDIVIERNNASTSQSYILFYNLD